MKEQWTIEKAKTYVNRFSWLLILSGIIGFFLGWDAFVSLGQDTSVFVSPYLFNIFTILLSVFHIMLGVLLKSLKNWTRLALVAVVCIRFFLGVTNDWGKIVISIAIICFIFPIFSQKKAGWIFQNK